jgi:hypothetical protein
MLAANISIKFLIWKIYSATSTQRILTELTLHNFVEDIPGLSNYVVDQFQYEVKLPAVVISVITLEKLHTWLSEGRNLTVRITSTGNNGKYS